MVVILVFLTFTEEILNPLGKNYTLYVGLAWATDATLSQEK